MADSGDFGRVQARDRLPRKRKLFQRIASRLSPGHAGQEHGGDRVFQALEAHFFQRFFDNDALSSYGDMVNAAANALMLTALPGLAAAFIVGMFLLHPMPIVVGSFDDYFFVSYSFAGMGLLTVFEWEMLFADRVDFLVLTPLPVTKSTMLGAKVKALARFLGMFLLSVNALSTMLVPGVKGHNYLLAIAAHMISVAMAGCFAALLLLGVGGTMLCVLRTATFRRVLPIAQLLTVAVLVWMLLQLDLFEVAMQMPAKSPPVFAQWLPPIWFAGVYQKLLLGSAAPVVVGRMARTGAEALALAAAVTAVTYPLAWRRKQRMTLEDAAGKGRRPGGLARLLMWVGTRQPEERAVFSFIGQTMRRNQRYQTYLMMYGGVGSALAAACVVSMTTSRVGAHRTIGFAVSDEGLYALMPLFLFWTIVGVRTAFAFPVELSAGWVFGLCSAELGRCASAARRWSLLHGLVLVMCVLVLQGSMRWKGARLEVQAILGVSLAMVLTDLFFAFRRGVPFTQPRLQGKSNVAIAVALYVGVLPQFVTMMMTLAKHLESRPAEWWIPPVLAMVLRLGLGEVQRREGLVYEVREEEIEGTLILGLMQ